MQLSPAHVEKLRDSIRTNPLAEQEIRRVIGAGEQYIALSTAPVDKEKYTQMYALSVDGKSITIFAKINPSSGASVG